MSDPSLLVTRPTATDPALAPEGSDLAYILAPAPNLARGQIDWNAVASGYADQLAPSWATGCCPAWTRRSLCGRW